MRDSNDSVRPIQWKGEHLELLDQRKLPQSKEHVVLKSADEVAEAISSMVVRGAPAIGMTAAYGLVLEAKRLERNSGDKWRESLMSAYEVLMNSRPTAVNLRWALERMKGVVDRGASLEELEVEANLMMKEDLEGNHRMGELGSELIKKGSGIYTHCNTGSLATAGYGTALGVVRNAYAKKLTENIYAGETRPWLQGARLTAWELLQDGIPVKLVVEGAAGSLFQEGKVEWVIVGADRITVQGDTANKIGTYNLAVLARHHGARFMVVAHSSTIDKRLVDGKDIPIETRPASEVTQLAGNLIAPEGIPAYNPAFDVTPHDLIDVIVTEKGVVKKPDLVSMESVLPTS